MSRDGETQTVLDRLDSIPFSRFHVLLIVLVFIAVAFDNMDQATLSFVIPQYSKEWGLTPVMTRIHPALGIGGTLVGAIIGGIVADKIGRKRTFNIMILVFAFTELANAFAQSFVWVVTACFVMGIGVGAAVPIAFSLISEFAPAKIRGMMQILVGVISIGVGYLIASGAAYVFMPILGWRFLFAVGVIPALLIPFIQKYVPESTRFLLAKGKFQEAIESVRQVESVARVGRAATLTTSTLNRESLTERIGSVTEVWTRKYRALTLLTWIYGGLWGFFNFSFLVWLPTVLITGFGYSSNRAAYYTSIVDLAAIPVGFLTAVIFDKWGRKRTLTVYPIIGGTLTVLTGWLGAAGLLEPILFILTGIVIYSTGFALAGMFPPYVSEVYETNIRASGTGWAVGISRITGVLGLAAGGGLLTIGTNGVTFFVIIGVPLVLAGLGMAFLGVETKKKRLEEIVPKISTTA
jgi:putative MFS transporter